MMKSLSRLKTSLAAGCLLPLALAAAAPVVPAWDIGKEKPHLHLNFGDARKQQASYEVMPGGEQALKIDLTKSVHGGWEGFFRSYRILPDFTEAALKIRYFVPEKCAVTRLTVVLCDRNNERFPLDFKPEKTPGWHVKSFPLDSRKFQKNAWRTSIRSGHYGAPGGQTVPIGRVNYYDMPMRVIGVNGAAALNKGLTGWVGIGRITLEEVKCESAIRPGLDTGTSVHVLKKGDEGKLALTLFNPEAKRSQGFVDVVVSDVYGKILEARSADFDVPSGETFRIPLTVPKKYGVYKVVTRSHAKGKLDTVLEQRFCYMDPTGATPGVKATGFLFGLNTHFQQWRIDAETEAEAMALCGAKVVREAINWRWSQPDNKLPFSFASTDDPMEPFEKLGIEVQPSLIFTPDWAVDPTVKVIWPERWDRAKFFPKLDLWRKYCRDYFIHTKGRMRFYEVWNEADIQFANFDWAHYIELQRSAYEELKKVNPEAQIMTCGYTRVPGGGLTDPNHMLKTMADRASYDVLAFHGHTLYHKFRKDVPKVTGNLRKIAPGKPWYANETAYSAVNIGELEQSIQLFKKLIFVWSQGAIGYNWYDLRNDGFDPAFGEHHFGMVTHDFYPKAVYAVYNTLTKHLTGAKYEKVLSDEPAIEGYLFRSARGDVYYAFWGWQPGEHRYAVKNVTGKASLIDQYGNETPLPVQDGCVMVPVKNEGQFLRLQKAAELPQLAGYVMAPGILPLSVERGAVAAAEVRILNPLPHPAELCFTLTPPAGLKITPDKWQAKLAPGEKRVVKLALAADKNVSDKALAQGVKMTQTLDGRLLGVDNLPVIAAMGTIRHKVLPKQPHFLLNQDQKYVQNDLAPESLWKGPHDLSAGIYMRTTDAKKPNDRETLYVRIDVKDDRFHQPYHGFDCYNGDNVQLFIAIPGVEEFWEFGVSKTDKGVEKFCYRAPHGFGKTTAFGAKVTPMKESVRYELWLPLRRLGITEKIGRNGFRFNCFVNDNDGTVRKGYMAVFPDKLPEHFPVVYFR